MSCSESNEESLMLIHLSRPSKQILADALAPPPLKKARANLCHHHPEE